MGEGDPWELARRGFRRRCHRIGIWMFGMKPCVLADSSRSSFPTLGQDELQLTPPWQMFAPTLMVPIKRELFGITEASLVTL